MRKALALLIVALLIATPAFAVSRTATFGDQNSSGTYRLTAENDGQLTFASDTSIKYPYSTHSTVSTNTLDDLDTGKFIVDTGGAKHVLPTPEAGMVLTFSAGAQVYMTVDTATTDTTILYSVTGTSLDGGDSIKSTGQAGDSVTLCAPNTTTWAICGMKGTWTDNGTN